MKPTRGVACAPCLGSCSVIAVLLGCVLPAVPAAAQGEADLRNSRQSPGPTYARGNVVAETLGGLIGVGVVGGLLYAGEYGADSSTCAGEPYCGAAYGFGTVFVAPLIVGLGVWTGGELTGGNGSYWATFLGALGTLPGILLLSIADAPPLIGLGIAMIPLGYLALAVIGYHLTDSDSSLRVSVAPTADLSGARLVLGGSL